MVYWYVKTTLEISDDLFRSAKAKAAQDGISLKEFVTAALREKLDRSASDVIAKPWMKHFGILSHLRKENRRIERLIEQEFETVDPEDWK